MFPASTSTRPNACGVQLQAWVDADPVHHLIRAAAELRPVRQCDNEFVASPIAMPMRFIRLVLVLDEQQRATAGPSMLTVQRDAFTIHTDTITAASGVAHVYAWAESENEYGQPQPLQAQSLDVNVMQLMWGGFNG